MVVNDGNDRPAAMVPDDPAAIIRILGLEPLPDEGGMFRQMYKDGSGTAIYFMVADGDFSALHLLDAPEIYHWYGGAPLDLLLLGPDGDAERVLVGPNLLEGQRPQVVVPAGVWQGSSSTGHWSEQLWLLPSLGRDSNLETLRSYVPLTQESHRGCVS